MRPILSKRDIAAGLLGGRLMGTIAPAQRKTVRILAYHRVLDGGTPSFPFDDGVISADTEAFYNQIPGKRLGRCSDCKG